MKRLVWITDIHLNFLSPAGVDAFCDRVANAQPEAVLVGGDIGEATDVEKYLQLLAARLERPLYFVGQSRFLWRFHRQGRNTAIPLFKPR